MPRHEADEAVRRRRTPSPRSPSPGDHHDARRRDRRHDRSRSPRRDHHQHDDKRRRRDHHHHHHRRHATPPPPPPATELPFAARRLSYKHDLPALEPLFASYLDIQKGLRLEALAERERRGRWKSFVSKWNRGELAEGWYDPETYERVAREEATVGGSGLREEESAPAPAADHDREMPPRKVAGRGGPDEGEEDDYGPPPPPPPPDGRPRGPGVPSLSDLALQREAASEDVSRAAADVRLARKADRALQKERLDELVPRAEPGTRERRLEKRALVGEKMKGFREGRGGGGEMEEVGDGELFGGGGDDGVEALRKEAAAQQRKKTERELRREAEARARREEREERLREWREKEEEKLRGLKELARARFG